MRLQTMETKTGEAPPQAGKRFNLQTTQTDKDTPEWLNFPFTNYANRQR